MRIDWACRAIVLAGALSLLACKERSDYPKMASTDNPAEESCPASGERIRVEQGGSSSWKVLVDSCMGDALGRGEARVRAEAVQDGSPAHALARARAWLNLARQLADAGRTEDAMLAARRGLSALGDRYAPAQAVDDTQMKIAATDLLVSQGRTSDALAALLRVLDTRQRLFLDLHRAAGLE